MSWLLLILTLPTENATARMRAWRALKAAGAAVLRDGVYILPGGEREHATFSGIAREVDAAGGTTHLLESLDGDYAALFDRSDDYRKLTEDIVACHQELDAGRAPAPARQARRLRRRFDALAAIDFFPGLARAQAAALLDALDQAMRVRLSPDEPTSRPADIRRRDLAEYQGRRWATRRRPWVDRLASAWLIQRFIDRQAQFLWLAQPADCPADALGFDFDGAEFSHVGERVTFETLLASFGLESEAGLGRLACIVHYLDVGGVPAAEAAGLEAVLGGMRGCIADDDALLAAACYTFDYLHHSLKEHA